MFNRNLKNLHTDAASKGRGIPEWANWVISYALLAGSIYWITTMPSRFFEPYCQAQPSRKIVEYYGTALSDRYRRALIYSLEFREIPYFEFGDRVLVPFVDPGYFDEKMHGPARFLKLILGNSEESWSLTIRKTTSSLMTTYAEEYPNSEIAQLKKRYFRLFELDSIKHRKILDRIDCELTRLLADPSLTEASS